ncbi:hypothetical protein C7B76_12385 [filamentous cyanobacterium CCP2]|nr:hypothetical protein C7B76_12385 [filamentous cyanobacterium CCP2]
MDCLLEWTGDVPEMREQMFQVYVTFLGDKPVIEPKTRGKKMAEVLEKLAATQVSGSIDPVV